MYKRQDQAIYDYWREMPGDAEGRDYANEIVRGVCADQELSLIHISEPTRPY